MKKVNINYKNIVNSNKSFQKKSRIFIENEFKNAKNDFLKEFDNHKITQEIEAGPNASNTSGTLNGKGNLFSFIGFNKNSDPVSLLRQNIKKGFSISTKKITNGFRFLISYPSFEELKKATPMPWETGNSWIQGIENGISGFSNYMYKRFSEGRSGAALQSNNTLRDGSFNRTNYISGMINNFIKRIERAKR